MTAVHQLLPVYSSGDAIGGAVRKTQTMLRDLGFESDVFAELTDQKLRHDARDIDDLWTRLGEDDTLIYHLSIGASFAKRLARTAARLILVYHNITPPRFFRDTNPRVTYWLERGDEDLRLLAPRAALCICDSEYNEGDAIAAGAQRTMVIAPPVDLTRLDPATSSPSVPPVLLFVGRLAPNKRHDRLIRILAALRATHQPEARLVLAGGSDDTGAYVTALLALARRLGVEQAVEIPEHRLSDADLRQLYMEASVFVCASEHEGFCIPLLEAMAFGVPVVAYNAGAVPGTLGDAGVVIDHRDPLVWAAVVDRVIGDQALRQVLRRRSDVRLGDFADVAIQAQLSKALEAVGVASRDRSPA